MYNLFGKTEFKVSDKLTLRIPLVSEVKNCENNKFYELIMSFICSTYDCLLTVEDLGVDFREMSDYNWFLCLFQAHFKNIEQQYWEMLFPNLNVKELFITANEDNELFIENKEGVIIDEKIYTIISDVLRQIFGVEKYTEYRNMPDWKKNILIMDKRLELQRKIENKNPNFDLSMDNLILTLVNDYGYDFSTVDNMTVFDFSNIIEHIIQKNKSY